MTLIAGDNGMGKSTLLEAIAKNPPSGPTYGPDELHHLSHGESVWAVVTHRFSDGLYLLDEPEETVEYLISPETDED